MKIFATITLALGLAACATTDYQPYELRSGSETVEGIGGSKSVVEGFDVWDNGNPPRKYVRLGVVSLETNGGAASTGMIQYGLVEAIKAAKGDAAIVMDKAGGGQTTGFGLSSSGQVSSFSGFGKRRERYEIVRYVD